ncbi:MAG: DUF3137 domain-containing protein [Victivallales bacterium]
MERIRKILGWYSPYPHVRWMRCGALLITLVFAITDLSKYADLGLFEFLLSAILTAVVFVVVMVISLLLESVVNTILRAGKQKTNREELQEIGSAEMLELDKLRIKAQRMSRLFVIGPVAYVLSIFFCYYYIVRENVAGGVASFIAGHLFLAVAWYVKLSAGRKYKSVFKDQVVKTGLESVLSDMKFDPNRTLDEKAVLDSQLFPKYDIYNGNDYLSATYGQTHFTQSDIHLIEEREELYRDKDGEWNTRIKHVTLFRGRLAAFDYDAISNEPVFVFDRRGNRFKKGVTETELHAFNKKFVVSADSPTAAFRILTPPVLEGIVLASEKLKCPMYMSFINDKIYVALSNGDAFEAQAHGDMTLSEQLRFFRGEIQAMLDMIETIYLKNKEVV